MPRVAFDSWEAVMAYAREGRPLWYQPPMDRFAKCFTAAPTGAWTYSARSHTIRMMPYRVHADPFVADAGHLDRFSRPA